MRYKYFINELATVDIEQSFIWYEARSKKAACNFLDEVDNAIEKVCINPKTGRNKHEDCFEIRLTKYPFTLLYLVDEKKKIIIITGVFHNRRDPKKKYRNL